MGNMSVKNMEILKQIEPDYEKNTFLQLL